MTLAWLPYACAKAVKQMTTKEVSAMIRRICVAVLLALLTAVGVAVAFAGPAAAAYVNEM
jgi:hypothetical protein